MKEISFCVVAEWNYFANFAASENNATTSVVACC